MTDIRSDPKVRDLAEFASRFAEHQDIDELHRRGQALIARHESSSDLASWQPPTSTTTSTAKSCCAAPEKCCCGT